jgi:hypothetical protein
MGCEMGSYIQTPIINLLFKKNEMLLERKTTNYRSCLTD